MKKLWAIFITVFLTGVMLPAHASEADELIIKLSAARESLLLMILNRDKRDEDQQRVVENTADAVSAHLAKMTAPEGKEHQLSELIEIWKAFKETREKELVPAILKGDNVLAKDLFGGIQKERAAKCRALANELAK